MPIMKSTATKLIIRSRMLMGWEYSARANMLTTTHAACAIIATAVMRIRLTIRRRQFILILLMICFLSSKRSRNLVTHFVKLVYERLVILGNAV